MRKKTDGEVEARQWCVCGRIKGWLGGGADDSNNLLKVCSLFLENLKIFSANNIAPLPVGSVLFSLPSCTVVCSLFCMLAFHEEFCLTRH